MQLVQMKRLLVHCVARGLILHDVNMKLGNVPVTGTLCIENIGYRLISSEMEIQSFVDETTD